MDATRRCAICGSANQDTPWVLLNRYAYGTGACKGFRDGLNNEGEYVWDPSEDIATGIIVCFPACLQTFLEGRMIEADIAMGNTR